MKREVRTIIKTALDKITAFVLSVLAAFSFAFGGDVLVEAGNAYSNWWTSPTPDNVRIEEYVENASINKENSKIKDFHDYTLNVTKLEIALRDHGKNAKIKENSAISQEEFDALNGKLAGLVDDFDYISLIQSTNLTLKLVACDDEATSTYYIFDISNVAKKMKLSIENDLDLFGLINGLNNSLISKNDFKLLYKYSNRDKIITNEASNILKKEILNDNAIRTLLNKGYEYNITPYLADPSIRIQTSQLNSHKPLTSITVWSGPMTLMVSSSNSNNGDTGKLLFYVCLNVNLFNPTTLDQKTITYTLSYNYRDNNGSLDQAMNNIGTYSELLKKFNITVARESVLSNSITQDIIGDDFSDLVFQFYDFSEKFSSALLKDISNTEMYDSELYMCYNRIVGRIEMELSN